MYCAQHSHNVDINILELYAEWNYRMDSLRECRKLTYSIQTESFEHKAHHFALHKATQPNAFCNLYLQDTF